MFLQLGVIPRLSGKFIETVAVVEHYLVITRVKERIKEAAVPNMPLCNNMP